MDTFTKQKAVVTGATRGIGRAVTEALLAQGAAVIGLYSGNEAAAEELTSACTAAAKERLQLHKVDVSNYQAVESFFRQVEQECDTIDVLVNNAGIRRDAALAMMRREDWNQVIDVNLTGGYNMTKFAVHLMMKQKWRCYSMQKFLALVPQDQLTGYYLTHLIYICMALY